MFGIFRRKKKMTIKKMFDSILDEMWVCAFQFRPWDENCTNVVFKKVRIVKAEATDQGIYVLADEKHPFDSNCSLDGYVDKFTDKWSWTGFFETEREAKDAHNDLMDKWIGVIKTWKVPIQ